MYYQLFSLFGCAWSDGEVDGATAAFVTYLILVDGRQCQAKDALHFIGLRSIPQNYQCGEILAAGKGTFLLDRAIVL